MSDSTVQVGYAFEGKVAAYYEALGFKIDRNITIGGHQIDLLATKYMAGASILSYIIEAKYRDSGSVGVNDVTPFINTARDLIASGEANGAVMITNRGYTEKAKGKTNSSKVVRLLTINELESELFNTSESLLRCCTDYERTNIIDEYIPLAGVTGSETRKETRDIVKHLQEWALNHTGIITLTGDFGSGKTTIVDRIFYNLAKSRIASGYGPYPIQLRLRSLLSYSSLWSFLNASLRDTQYVTPSQAVFNAMLDAGGFVIILDGFDEIHTGATASDRAKFLKLLLPLLASKSPCIISTRPTYFDSFREMKTQLAALLAPTSRFERLDNPPVDLSMLLRRLDIEKPDNLDTRELLNTVAIKPLSPDDIRRYLQHFREKIISATGNDENFLIDFLYQIYDLQDLLRRPLLLHMILVSIVEGGLDIARTDRSIGPSTLYEMYTQVCAKRDASKKGVVPKATQFLTVGERLQACRELAKRMLKKGAIELTVAEVINSVDSINLVKRKMYSDMSRQEWRERAVTDIRLCSFLSFSDDGILRFAHKSFFEFFVAQSLLIQMEDKLSAIDEFSKYELSKDILGFLGSYARDNEKFGHIVEMAFHNRGGGDKSVDSLLNRIAIASGILLERVKIKKSWVGDVELRRAEVNSASAQELSLSRVTFSNILAKKWQLLNCAANDSNFDNSRFHDCRIDLRGANVNIKRTQFADSDVRLAGQNWDIENTDVIGATFTLDASGRFRNVNAQNLVSLMLGSDLHVGAMSTLQLKNCTVFQGASVGWYDRTSRIAFMRCALLGVYVEAADILEISSGRRSPIHFDNCEGVVITRNAGKLLPENGYLWLPNAPKILVVDSKAIERAANAVRGFPRVQDPKSEVDRLLAAQADETRRNALRVLDQMTTISILVQRKEHLVEPILGLFTSQ